MAYEMLVNASVTGQPQVEGLGKATDDLAARTSKLNDVMYGESAAITKLAFGLDKLTAQSLASAQAHDQLSLRMATVIERMNAGTAATDNFAGATGRASIGTRNMTATLRGLEGAMPIRAAANLLASFSALGPIAQVAFQVVGVVAMASILGTVAEKLGIHLNFWKQIAEMQKESNKELQESAGKMAELLKKDKELADEEYKRTHGGMAAQARTAVEYETKARTTDTIAVANLESQLAVARKILAARPSLNIEGEPGPVLNVLTPQEQTAGAHAGIPGLIGGWELGKTQIEGAKLAQRNLEDLTGPLAVARQQQYNDFEQARMLREPKKDPDVVAQEAREKAEDAAKKAQTKAEERAARMEALESRTREMQIKALYTDSGPGYNLMFPPVNQMIPMDPHVLEGATRQREAELERIRTERAKELKTATPGEVAGINAEYGKQETATWTIYTKEASAALKEFTEKVKRAAEGADKIGEEYDKGREKQIKETEALLNVIAPVHGPSVPAGWMSPERRLQIDRMSEQAQL